METALLKKIPSKYLSAYRHYYMLQNLVAVRTCSAVFLVLNVIIRLLYMIFPENLTGANNFPEFNITNWVYIIITPIFLFSSSYLVVEYKKRKRALTAITAYVFVFAVYLISCGMVSSFIATSDPSNALTLYMVPLIIIGVVCVFEMIETILLIVLIELIFTALLIYVQATASEVVSNELISIILLFGFFLTSRYFYTYKANYYKQVLEIREKNVEIENAANFKNQVLGMVAHDLRNPLAAVESTAMIMEMEEVDAETRENLDIIKASCAKARSIILDLLEAAKNDNDQVYETTRIDLNTFIRKILDSWKIHNEARNTLVFRSQFIPLYAAVNREKFHRVIDNLISNAIKFSKENDKIEINLDKENGFAIIEVVDHGLGIPKDLIPHLFDRFTRAGRTGTRGEQSTGLGLSIVRQIVQRHRGTIDVTSIEGQGSIFTIRIPAVD